MQRPALYATPGTRDTYDVVVVGAGVIGLSIARACAQAGLSVAVLDHRPPQRSASWAAGGILPHRGKGYKTSGYVSIIAESSEQHAHLSAELLEETGIADGYERCGELELALDDQSAVGLEHRLQTYRTEGVRVERLDGAQVTELEPSLARDLVRACYHLPETAQVRPPRRLRALRMSCLSHGVDLDDDAEVHEFLHAGDKVVGVICGTRRWHAGTTVLAAGAWSGCISRRVALPVRPIRGQLVLLQERQRAIRQLLSIGAEYLVPRDDGEVLVGSTMEDVGFDDRTTAGAVADLITRATMLVPRLRCANVARTWAGLRPATPDARPMIGWSPDHRGLLLATGHERLGFQMAPATGRVVKDLVLGVAPGIDMQEFAPSRFASSGPARGSAVPPGRADA